MKPHNHRQFRASLSAADPDVGPLTAAAETLGPLPASGPRARRRASPVSSASLLSREACSHSPASRPWRVAEPKPRAAGDQTTGRQASRADSGMGGRLLHGKAVVTDLLH